MPRMAACRLQPQRRGIPAFYRLSDGTGLASFDREHGQQRAGDSERRSSSTLLHDRHPGFRARH